MSSLNAGELSRYSRHIMLPEIGLEGQQKLKDASVLIVGAGGLGAPLALYLAASGIGHLGIVDYDQVDDSNLQRQILHNTEDIGRKKTESAYQHLKQLNPNIEIEVFDTKIVSNNAMDIIGGFDVVADGTDNFPTRYLINDVCVFLGKPNVYASIFAFEGQASVFATKDGPCYRCLFSNPPTAGTAPSCHEAGVMGVLPGVMGCIQATEVIKIILNTGRSLAGQLLTYDALEMDFTKISIHKNSDCPVCGTNPTITAPIDYEEFCQIKPKKVSDNPKSKVKEILPLELKQAVEYRNNLFLLDVREKQEVNICSLTDAYNIPMNEITPRLDELPRNKMIVVFCHHGIRSLHVANYLLQQGFENVYNLTGGIDRYALDCDPSLTRY